MVIIIRNVSNLSMIVIVVLYVFLVVKIREKIG